MIDHYLNTQAAVVVLSKPGEQWMVYEYLVVLKTSLKLCKYCHSKMRAFVKINIFVTINVYTHTCVHARTRVHTHTNGRFKLWFS